MVTTNQLQFPIACDALSQVISGNQTKNSAVLKQRKGRIGGGSLLQVSERQWNTFQEVQFEENRSVSMEV